MGVARLQGRQTGFTIVELMIATMVFSVILLVITEGVLSFTHAYYSGLNSSATQNAVRNIIGNVTHSIEFSGDPVATTDQTDGTFFCAGSKVYVFKPGVEYQGGNTTSDPGLYVMPSAGSCPSSRPSNLTGGKQLLGTNMRITRLSVTRLGATRSYVVAIRLAYGEGDLLCNTGNDGRTGGCAKGDQDYDTTSPVTGDDVACKQQSGFQFCAVAGLTTTATLRVSNSAS